MFPTVTPDIVRAEQSHRLEGFRRWSLLHRGGVEPEAGRDGVAQTPSRHSHYRPALGR